jgi:5-methylcytosine-specific restriction endonuclease McrA
MIKRQPISEKTRQKLREGTKRYFQEHPEARTRWSEMYSGKGKHLSLAHKKKISETQKKRPAHSQFSSGHQPTKEQRRKIGEAHKGNKYFLGKHHSEATRQKISEAVAGEKSGNWQGGKSFEPYSPSFNRALKQKALKRDKYICQNCGLPKGLFIRKGGLDVHHMDGNKQNSKLTNLVTLCKSCHRRADHERFVLSRAGLFY